jgi:hypothetical protein
MNPRRRFAPGATGRLIQMTPKPRFRLQRLVDRWRDGLELHGFAGTRQWCALFLGFAHA